MACCVVMLLLVLCCRPAAPAAAAAVCRACFFCDDQSPSIDPLNPKPSPPPLLYSACLFSYGLHLRDGISTNGKPSSELEKEIAPDARTRAANTPGRFAVAYLQLASLKKAPLVPKKPIYSREESTDAPKSSKRSGRLSLFRSSHDSSSSSAGAAAIAKGTVVHTFMGLATVRKVRSQDGMCEVRVCVCVHACVRAFFFFSLPFIRHGRYFAL